MTGFFATCDIKGLGPIWVAVGPRGIVRLSFGRGRRDFLRFLPTGIEWTESPQSLRHLLTQLTRYGIGRPLVRARLPLDPSLGTDFQRGIWRAIRTIPYGEVRSYMWVAKRAGFPRAFRAAANACGANPAPIITPCHRVIASDGSIGGFSSGLVLKRHLLKMEGTILDER